MSCAHAKEHASERGRTRERARASARARTREHASARARVRGREDERASARERQSVRARERESTHARETWERVWTWARREIKQNETENETKNENSENETENENSETITARRARSPDLGDDIVGRDVRERVAEARHVASEVHEACQRGPPLDRRDHEPEREAEPEHDERHADQRGDGECERHRPEAHVGRLARVLDRAQLLPAAVGELSELLVERRELTKYNIVASHHVRYDRFIRCTTADDFQIDHDHDYDRC